MSINIELPNIIGTNSNSRLNQITSYLYQLAGQLRWAFSTLESGASTPNIINYNGQSVIATPPQQSAESTFDSIKSLIIKSADIVESYTEAIKRNFEGVYVAESDFGTYREQTSNLIYANSKEMESVFSSIQEIISAVEEIESSIINTNAYIKAGLLESVDGVNMYGVEIGQRNTDGEGTEIFNKFARFVSNKLSFFDHDVEVAYISDYKLYINHVMVNGSLSLGRFVSSYDDVIGLAIRWE